MPVPLRRRLLASTLTILAVLSTVTPTWAPAWALEDQVVVVTSYPEEMTGRYEQAFEKANPGVDLRIVWKHAREAQALLTSPGHGGADVYWTPSLPSFPALRDAGMFRPLAVDRAVLPGRIGAQEVSDPQGTYEAFEVAGYGIITNPAALAARGLTPPTSWRDLAQARFAGLVSLPIASQVGFSPALYESLLQDAGWDDGWALIGEIAGNARPITAGGQVADSVQTGETVAGLTIDFFARSAIANGHPVGFVYPPRTAFVPAQVAITAHAPHPDAAKAFVDFVLSAEGQAMLFHPDIRRSPVRPDVYGDASAGQVNPFAQNGGFAYDVPLGLARSPLVVALFDRLVTERLPETAALWQTIHAAEAALGPTPAPERAERLARARALAGWVPVTAQDAADPALSALFRARRDTPDADARARALEATWTEQVTRIRAEALALAQQAAGL